MMQFLSIKKADETKKVVPSLVNERRHHLLELYWNI